MNQKTNKKSLPSVTISSFLAKAVTLYPHTSTRDIELLLSVAINKTNAYLRAFSEEQINTEAQSTLNSQLEKLADGFPLAYIIGKQAFWDMDLIVNQYTLIPRPDTEILIETIESTFPRESKLKIIDLGTGTGAIAIALSRIFPNAIVSATDLSPEALAVAKQNIQDWAKKPVVLHQSSWLTNLSESFDIIVSNPPYIAEEDKHLAALTYEPITALTSGDKGLNDLREIITNAPNYLNKSGWLFLEHGYDQGQAVREIFPSDIWRTAITVKDYGKNDRVTYAQLKHP